MARKEVDFHNDYTGNNSSEEVDGNGSSNKIEGRGGNDTLYGYNDNDRLYGDDGDDSLYGGNDNDHLYGGSGDDKLYGDDNDDNGVHRPYHGNDKLYGNDGNDIIYGYRGQDRLEGGSGNDKLYGGDGDDRLAGGLGYDEIYGGNGIDTLYFTNPSYFGVTVNLAQNTSHSEGHGSNKMIDRITNIENVEGTKHIDVIFGDDKSNKLDGKAGSDSLNGGKGDDVLIGGDGDDVVAGNDGSDTFIAGRGDNAYYGYNGTVNDSSSIKADAGDVVNYYAAGSSVSVFLELNVEAVGYPEAHKLIGTNFDVVGRAFDNGFGGNDLLMGIEQVIGSQHGDFIVGSHKENLLKGGNGDDKLYGERVDDILSGSILNSVYGTSRGKAGVDQLYGGHGNDVLDPGGSNSGGREVVVGGTGSDKLYVRNGLNSHYHGDEGNEVTGKGYANNHGDFDTLSYEKANQMVHVDLETSTNMKGWFGDTLGMAWNNGFGHAHFVSGFEQVIGSRFNDTIIGGSKNETIRAGAGDDIVIGRGGEDKLYGGDGFDTLDYSSALVGVELQFETESDRVGYVKNNGYGHSGNVHGFEKVIGSDFNDKILGGKGADTIYGGHGDDHLNTNGSAAHAREYIDAGAGRDIVIASNSGHNSHYHGGHSFHFNDFVSPSTPDKDLIDYSNATNGIHLVLELDVNGDGKINTFDGGSLGVAWNNGFGHVNFVSGFEEVIGSNHNDSISGNNQDNVLRGEDGNDVLKGMDGADSLYGGNGDDTLDAGGSASTDREVVVGGAGSDTILVSNSGLNSHYHGDIWSAGEIKDPGGTDVIDYSNAITGVHLQLDMGHDWSSYELGIAWNNGFGQRNFVTGFEEVVGSGYNDIISGNSKAETFKSGAGDDVLVGGAGADDLYGGAGADTYKYTSFNDSTSHHTDKVFGFESGSDKIDLSSIVGGDNAWFHFDKSVVLQIEETNGRGLITAAESYDYKLSLRGTDFEIEFHDTAALTVDDVLF